MHSPISGSQCRAARAYFGWSRGQLARAASSTISIIKAVENDSARIDVVIHESLKNFFMMRGVLFTVDRQMILPFEKAV